MVAIADHCLGCLGQQGMSVVQHYALHLTVPRELLLESTLRQTIRGTGELYDCMAGHALPAQKQCDPKRAVVPHARDLRRRTVCSHVHLRYDGVGRKIDILQHGTGLAQDFSQRHLNQPQVRTDSFALRERQRGEQPVLLWSVGSAMEVMPAITGENRVAG
jgi:hypothetical protein